jgi:type VI protein secretion system component Hcp
MLKTRGMMFIYGSVKHQEIRCQYVIPVVSPRSWNAACQHLHLSGSDSFDYCRRSDGDDHEFIITNTENAVLLLKWWQDKFCDVSVEFVLV